MITGKESLDQLFESFLQKQILIIGDVMIDSYLWGKVDRISPEAPVPVVSLKKRENRLGGAANVALNIQSMGALPILCSVVGDDDKGKLLFQLMQEQGLDPRGILCSENRITTTKFRIIGNNAQMLRVDEETEKELSGDETRMLISRIGEIINQTPVSAIVFEDYDKGVITTELIENVVALGKSNGIPVVVDPKKKNFMNYRGVTLFKPNLKELYQGLKLDEIPETPEDIMQAVIRLQQLLDVEMAMATLSEKGVCYSHKTTSGNFEKGIIPAHVRNISDVSGAGDTVISIIALCLSADLTARETAMLANLAGGLVCEYIGVVPIDRSRLYQEALKTFQ